MEAKGKIRGLRRMLPILAVVGSMSLASCDSSKEIDSPAVKDEAIGFGVLQSKAAPVTVQSMTSMGVFGYYTSDSEWDDVTSAAGVPKYFTDQLVTKKSGAWTYSPLKYWPASADEKITFFAYSPHSSTLEENLTDNLTVSFDPDKGTPIVHYIVSPDVEDQIDLLYATPLIDQSRTTSPLAFTMNHALTQISFSVVFASSESQKGYKAEVTEVSITGVTVSRGTLDLTNGVWTPDDIEEETGDETSLADYTLSVAEGTLLYKQLDTGSGSSFTPQPLNTPNGYLMLLPQVLDEVMCMTVTVVTHVGTQEPTTQVTTVRLSDHSITEWERGKSINYLITIQGDYISTQTTLDFWVDKASSGNVAP